MLMAARTPKKVVIWGTGFVGRMVIAEIAKHPDFELVGVGVSNPDKVGRDVGDICGLPEPTGELYQWARPIDPSSDALREGPK